MMMLLRMKFIIGKHGVNERVPRCEHGTQYVQHTLKPKAENFTSLNSNVIKLYNLWFNNPIK